MAEIDFKNADFRFGKVRGVFKGGDLFIKVRRWKEAVGVSHGAEKFAEVRFQEMEGEGKPAYINLLILERKEPTKVKAKKREK